MIDDLEERVASLELKLSSQTPQRDVGMDHLVSRLESLELALKSHHEAVLSLVTTHALRQSRIEEATTQIHVEQAAAPTAPSSSTVPEKRQILTADAATQTVDTETPEPTTRAPPPVRTRPRKSAGEPSPLGRSTPSTARKSEESPDALKSGTELRRRKAAFAAQSGAKPASSSLALEAAKRQAARAAIEAQKAREIEKEEAWGWFPLLLLAFLGLAALVGATFAAVMSQKHTGEAATHGDML